MKQSIAQYVMIILLVAGAYFLGVYKTKTEFLEKSATSTPTQVDQQPPARPTTVDLNKVKELFDGKHITFGDKNAKTIIVEVSDPSCPYCHIAGGLNPELNNASPQFKLVKDGGSYVAPVPEIKKLVEDKEASFIWIYSNGHGNGEMATQTLYCADEQDKFWPAHDILMTKKGYDLINETVKKDLSKANLLVAQLSKVLDAQKLQSCLDSGKYKDQPGQDMAFVQALTGGAGTPTFFVNEKIVNGAVSWSAFEGLL